jgi:hypothetical protein
VSGPQPGDVQCRVSPLRNDAHHLCRANASEFCHVVTLRMGPIGSLLRVDSEPHERNNTIIPDDRAVWFGGGRAPYFNTSLIREIVMYDRELDDADIDCLHSALADRWMATPALDGSAPPPPPPTARPVDGTCPTTPMTQPDGARRDYCTHARDGICDDGGAGSEYALCADKPLSDCTDCGRCHLTNVPANPYIHAAWPTVALNTGGWYAGRAYDNVRTALYRGSWTLSFVLFGSRISQWGSKQVLHPRNSAQL